LLIGSFPRHLLNSRQDQHLYSQINLALQWYIERLQQKTTTQHIHDKQIKDTQMHMHTIFTLKQEELNTSLENI
jgi:hypothetical protein